MLRHEEMRNGKLSRAELFTLHEHFANEVRTSLDLGHRSLIFYVGLLSGILVAIFAGSLQVDPDDLRGLGLLIGPALIVWLAEVGYSTVDVFYHRFLDASVTLLNVRTMLKLDDPTWRSIEVDQPRILSKHGGFIPQWEGMVDWLEKYQELHPDSNAEEARNALLGEQGTTLRRVFRKDPRGRREAQKSQRDKRSRFQAMTLRDARRTMWAFELAGLLLALTIVITRVS